jgi:putative transcriptional regulator
MVQVLRNKNFATKFQILVEIAAGQPDIQQKSIAEKLDVTPQAISEYIKELLKEGLMATEGRSRYKVTKEGVNWVLKQSRELKNYFAFVGKVLTNISVCTAVADCDFQAGQVVGLRMKDGLLSACDNLSTNAKGIAISTAKKGEDVGISEIEGIVEVEPGDIAIGKLSSIQNGGSKNADLTKLKEEVAKKTLIATIGVEALIALRRINVEPNYFYGVKEAVVEAAWSGLSSLIVCVEEEISGLIKRIEDENLSYKLVDLRNESN